MNGDLQQKPKVGYLEYMWFYGREIIIDIYCITCFKLMLLYDDGINKFE